MDARTPIEQQRYDANAEIKRRRAERSARVQRWRETQRVNETQDINKEIPQVQPTQAQTRAPPPIQSGETNISTVAAGIAIVLAMLGGAIWYVNPAPFAPVERPLATALRSMSDALEKRQHTDAGTVGHAPHAPDKVITAQPQTPRIKGPQTGSISVEGSPAEDTAAPETAFESPPPHPDTTADVQIPVPAPQIPVVSEIPASGAKVIVAMPKPLVLGKPAPDNLAKPARPALPPSKAPLVAGPVPEPPSPTIFSKPLDELQNMDWPPRYEEPDQAATERQRNPPPANGVPPRGTAAVAKNDTRARARAEAVVIPPRANPRRPVTQPYYPVRSRELGESGTVVMLLTVDAEGYVRDAEVDKSSGFERLDQAAIKEALRSWKLLPGTVNGKPTAMQRKFTITFKL
jgi:protein TonB